MVQFQRPDVIVGGLQIGVGVISGDSRQVLRGNERQNVAADFAPAVLRDQVAGERHPGAAVIRLQIDGQHVHPGLHQAGRHGATDPARRAGDQRRAALQPIVAHPPRFRLFGERATNAS